MMAHEVWHCYEGDILGIARFIMRPPWIIEGQAEWVGASLYPRTAAASAFWPDYLQMPETSLVVRAYDAIGFYSQLENSGVDVWNKLIPILLADDYAAAFVDAGGERAEFLDIWAAGYARDGRRGAAWDMTGPGITEKGAERKALKVADGATEQVRAPGYGNVIRHITDDSAEVILIVAGGHARISDAAGNDYLVGSDGAYCHSSKGCACPNHDLFPTPLDLPGPEILFVITGANTGATATLVGMSTAEYCARPINGEA
jgi:hypothetical protein